MGVSSSSSSQIIPCCDAVMVETLSDSKILQPRHSLPVVNILSTHHIPMKGTPYNDFIELIIFALYEDEFPTPDEKEEDTIFELAWATSTYLSQSLIAISNNVPRPVTKQKSVPLETLYNHQISELHELGLTSTVSQSTLLSVLQKCDGDLELVLNWFQIREMRSHDDEDEEEVFFRPDEFLPSISLSSHPLSSNEHESFHSPISNREDIDELRKFLSKFGMDGYLEHLVWNGYDTIENLSYALIDDLLAAGMKIGHARRLISVLKDDRRKNRRNSEPVPPPSSFPPGFGRRGSIVL